MMSFLIVLIGISCFFFLLAAFDLSQEWRLKQRVARLQNVSAALKKPLHFLLERSRRRNWARLRTMPSFLELIGVGLSAGLSFERAWDQAINHLEPGPLKTDLIASLNEKKTGQTQQNVLDNLLKKTKDSRVAWAFVLMRQSLEKGLSLQDILFEQADTLRTEIRMHVEKKAQTLPLRMLFPLVLFVFPCIFLVIFGPLYIYYLQNGL